MHLSKRGFTVRLVTAAGEDSANDWHSRGSDLNTGPLLEALAVVQPLPRPSLDTGWLTEAGGDGLLVAVLGHVDQRDVPVLRRMHSHSGAALAVVVDVDAWLSPGAASGRDASIMLSQQGWRSVSLGPAYRLAAVWDEPGDSGFGGIAGGEEDEYGGPDDDDLEGPETEDGEDDD